MPIAPRVLASRCALPLAWLFALGCAAAPLELSVDVRTDLAPGEDFVAVRVQLEGEPESVMLPAYAGDPYVRGVRVADYRRRAPGRLRVRAALIGGLGEEVLARRVEVSLQRSYALTVTLDGACRGRSCPGEEEPASFTECLAGRCVEPACGGPRPSGCGALACGSDTECERLGCPAACFEGVCGCVGAPLDAGAAGGLDAGPPDTGSPEPRDAGPCPGECAPGAVEEQTRACGACGEGVERRLRACDADCRFGAYGAWGACETSAQCSPGQTDREVRACGNCDLGAQSRTRSCDTSSCRWGAFGSWTACSGGGACAPGATRAGCDPCGVEVCTASCTWGACQPAAGNECLRIRPGTPGPVGNNYRCCGTRRWQFCLDTCRWSASCEACPSCC